MANSIQENAADAFVDNTTGDVSSFCEQNKLRVSDSFLGIILPDDFPLVLHRKRA